MKLFKKSFILLFVFSTVTLSMFNSCSPKPTNSEAEELIRKEAPYWGLGGKDKTWFEVIEIIQWGTYNKEYKYWPAKVHVQGSCEYAFSGIEFFDRTYECKFQKDDFGNWECNR